MRASFSSRCDEYYNLKMLLIGEKFRAKAILERWPFGRRKKWTVDKSKLLTIYHGYSRIHV